MRSVLSAVKTSVMVIPVDVVPTITDVTNNIVKINIPSVPNGNYPISMVACYLSSLPNPPDPTVIQNTAVAKGNVGVAGPADTQIVVSNVPAGTYSVALISNYAV